jgi:phage terminase large subunit-like protein
VLGGRYSEGYCIANDFEQAQSRVFQAIVRIVEVSPLLRQSAKITSSRVEFLSTRATITALASDYAGAAGANPTITVFDELWGYTSERAHRLWLGILGASEAKEANLSGQDDVSPRLV